MANGVVMDRQEGTPQGGPLSPMLANVLLDEVDKELEKRGHPVRPGRFARLTATAAPTASEGMPHP
jgi:retron-type reverse transcriptase